MKGVAALIIISWLLTLTAGSLISYGMFSQLDELKVIVYRVSMILLSITGSFPMSYSQNFQYLGIHFIHFLLAYQLTCAMKL